MCCSCLDKLQLLSNVAVVVCGSKEPQQHASLHGIPIRNTGVPSAANYAACLASDTQAFYATAKVKTCLSGVSELLPPCLVCSDQRPLCFPSAVLLARMTLHKTRDPCR